MAPYRGVARPVITMAMERLMDKAAAAFAIEPLEIRRRNLIRHFPYVSATGLTFDEASYVEAMEKAAAAAGLPAFRQRQMKARADGHYLGLGVATFSERTGYGTPAFAARGMEVAPGWETAQLAMDPPGFGESATYDPPGTFSNACHIAVVAIDIETGKVMLEKLLVAEDAGRLINPMIAEGQIHGGVAQGIANALLEEIVYDSGGNVLTATFADYPLPTAPDVPALEIHHLATQSEAFSITKAKGLRERGAIGAPAAILKALHGARAP